ncbi:MAG: S8 family serine peptidase [Candidatus Eisenbacteria bacterium]|uniref:S8 family serine peptidase n=1 Tax=Eiseniibacteriota bacterium TaxID=2212470 RepID=A0A956SCE5_UNCEI|nr:S8 family serine peptidase [Candidatus Eisenbacteria bacterium]
MKARWIVLASLSILIPALVSAADSSVRLRSRTFVPSPSVAVLEETQAPVADRGLHFLVQLAPSVGADRVALEENGIRLLQYVPDNTWIARLDARAWNQTDARSALRWVGRLEVLDKVPSRIAEGRVGDWAFEPDGHARFRVRPFSDVTGEALRAALENVGAEPIRALAGGAGWLVRAYPEDVLDIAALEEVLWVSEDLPAPGPDNDGTRARVGADEVQSPPYNLTGFGVRVGLMDGGPLSAHPDFAGRVTTIDGTTPASHATHVAGTLGGTGLNSETQGGSSLQWRGIAPDVSFITWDYNGDVLQDYRDAIADWDIDVHHNSWGFTVSSQNCEIYGDYDFIVPDLDSLVVGSAGRRVPIVYSAGNERDDGDCPLVEGGYGCLNPPKAAKNLLIVGATNSDNDTMTDFSSWGPTDDGRLKPDVVAPGCEDGGEGYIKSTLPVDVYGGTGWCGTSMAAPVVSGAIALLAQAWDSTFIGTDPEPSFFKAILAATATDLGNPGPDYAFGHGRVDLEKAAKSLLGDNPITDVVAQDDVFEHTFWVAAGTQQLSVVLAWDDPPAVPNADPALINDLDLVLISPSMTTYDPWVLDPEFPSQDAVRGVDTVNNIEHVTVNIPQPGQWTARVTGSNVPQGPQIASLVGLDTAGPDAVSNVQVTQVTGNLLSFTWDEDRVFDFSGTMILRSLNPISFVPNNGFNYLEGQEVAAGVRVAYLRNIDHSVVPWDDGNLIPETDYYYAFYSFDDARIYSTVTELMIRTGDTSAVDPHALVAELMLAPPTPNPASVESTIRFGIPRDDRVQLRVFDPAGRRVATLVDGALEAGNHELRWSGRDDAGNTVGSGVYLLELRMGDERRSRRLTWRR